VADRTLQLSIKAKVLDDNSTVIWSDEYTRNTLPGRAVGLQLQGSNLVVQVSFTVYLADGVSDTVGQDTARSNYTLLAQGQIGIEEPNKVVQYRYAAQSIPVRAGEGVYFFPIGNDFTQTNAVIELLISIRPYNAGQEQNDNKGDPAIAQSGGN
jgi:hypothetical protein